MIVLRRLAAFVFAAVLSTALVAHQQVFRSNVDGVTIQASVRAGNHPVPDLTAHDFDVRDNGVPQEITTIAVEKVPLDLTILLDSSASVDGQMLDRLKTAVSDTAALLRPDDRLRLIAISQVLREVFSFRPRGQAMPLDALGAEGATSLYDALAAAMMRSSDPGRRQLVVAFTDGRDSTSILDEGATRQIARLSDAVVDIVVPVPKQEQPHERPATNSPRQQSLDTLLFTGSNVAAGSPSEMAARARALQPWVKKDVLIANLTELIAPTTGQIFTLDPADSISRAFRRVLDDFRASYVLQYVPQGVGPGGWHEVVVTIRKPGKYDVRARKGYQGRDRMSSEEGR
jgi:VWFA-related protein